MSGVRVLVGTRKGAFVLEADGKRQKWAVNGPFFNGWEIYHMKGSTVDPNRIFVSQTSGWFGQVIQRSDDDAPVVRRHPTPLGVQARLAHRAVADGRGHRVCRGGGRGPVPLDRRR